MAYNEDSVTEANPSGLFCTMAEGDAGRHVTGPEVDALTLTPDGQGGGVLSGWMVFSSGGANGPCPDDTGPHLGNPVGATFAGSISGAVLAGSGTFTAEGGRSVAITLEAIESELP